MTRRESLGLIGLGFAIAGCSRRVRGGLRIASTSAIRNVVIAEIYAAALERAAIRVERHIGYGDGERLMAALQRSDVDLFPGYIGATQDDVAFAESEKHWYQARFGVTWLERAPATEGPCLATSAVSAEKFSLVSLTQCSGMASRLRLAATADFVAAKGGLGRLQSVYGGFRFKSVIVCDDGKQYDVLNRDDADVANGFSTDAEIAEEQLGVLSDRKKCFSTYSVAPVTRVRSIDAQPRVSAVLNRISRALNQYAVQKINMECDLAGVSPHDVALEFVRHTKP